jgi:TPP-dependent pyruvate/acetoin dehydrogenase alpha subunit
MYDAERYRSKDEVTSWRSLDPIDTFSARLREAGLLDDDAVVALEKSVGDEIDAAIAFAEAGTDESVDELTRFVMSERGGAA